MQAFRDRTGAWPIYPVFHMAQALRALQAAYEKALEAGNGEWPDTEALVDALEGLEFRGLSRPVKIREDHQGLEDQMLGTTIHVDEYRLRSARQHDDLPGQGNHHAGRQDLGGMGAVALAGADQTLRSTPTGTARNSGWRPATVSGQLILLACLDGVAYAALVFMVAVGLTLIFGVLRILNVAHGSFYAVGAYTAASLGLGIAAAGLSPWLTFPALVVSAALVGGVLGALIERQLLQRIYVKEEVLQLLVTFAVFMILEDVQRLVWGVQPYFVDTPLSLLGTLEVGGVYLYPLPAPPAACRCRGGAVRPALVSRGVPCRAG